MKVSLVFLTWNRLELVKRCVTHNIERAKYPIEEICFVDNGSTDGTKEWIEENFPESKKIFNTENKGIAEGYNQLYSLVGGVDLIARPSCDMSMPEGWLKEMVLWHEKVPETGIVAMISSTYRQFLEKRYIGNPIHIHNQFIQPANALGSIVFKKELSKIKLSDSGLYGYDDTIWTEKVRQEGYLNYYCPGIVTDYLVEEAKLYPEYNKWKFEQIQKKEKEHPELLTLNKHING